MDEKDKATTEMAFNYSLAHYKKENGEKGEHFFALIMNNSKYLKATLEAYTKVFWIKRRRNEKATTAKETTR